MLWSWKGLAVEGIASGERNGLIESRLDIFLDVCCGGRIKVDGRRILSDFAESRWAKGWWIRCVYCDQACGCIFNVRPRVPVRFGSWATTHREGSLPRRWYCIELGWGRVTRVWELPSDLILDPVCWYVPSTSTLLSVPSSEDEIPKKNHQPPPPQDETTWYTIRSTEHKRVHIFQGFDLDTRSALYILIRS